MKKNNKKIIDLYIMFGTISKLYSKVNIFHSNNDSYLWLRNDGIKDIKINNVKYLKKISIYDEKFITEEYKDIINQINNINEDGISYRIYTDDSRFKMVLKPLILSNIIDNVDEFIIISEGNITEYLFENFSDEFIEKCNNKYLEILKEINNTPEKFNDYFIDIDSFSFWFSMKKNVKYMLPFSKYMKNNRINEKNISKMNLFEFDLKSKYLALKENEKKLILNNKGNDFKIDSSKKNIIILGTYDFGTKDFTAFLYKNLIDKALMEFNDYNFYFKGHPLYPVNENIKLDNYFKEKNIKVLDNSFPIEVMLWENPNLSVGGFCSSVNSLVELSRTKFIFGEDIGFFKLITDNNIKHYSIDLSQDFASELLKIRYDNENKYNLLREDVFVRMGNLEKIIEDNFYYLNNKYKIKSIIKKIKKRIFNKRV